MGISNNKAITEISILIKSMYSTWICIYTLMPGWGLCQSHCRFALSPNYDPTQVTSLKRWKSNLGG